MKAVWETTTRAVQDIQSRPQYHSATFLHKLFGTMREEKRKLADHRVIGNAITLFLGGTDTSQKALIVAFYFLATRPEIQAELYEEANSIDWEKSTMDDLYVQTPRLKSFLHEIHRFHAFPMMMLETQDTIPFCKNHELGKRQNLFILIRYCSIQKIAPSKDVPQSDGIAPPHEFDHRRYLVRDPQTGQVTGSVSPTTRKGAFLNFGHGVRSCPGRRYSELISYCVMISALQHFHMTLDPLLQDKVDFVYDAVMLSPKQDIRLILAPRSKK